MLDVVSTTRSAQDLLAATAALADFHHLITREHIDRWEAIEPDFAIPPPDRTAQINGEQPLQLTQRDARDLRQRFAA